MGKERVVSATPLPDLSLSLSLSPPPPPFLSVLVFFFPSNLLGYYGFIEKKFRIFLSFCETKGIYYKFLIVL
jgi:hypothetical protein